MVDRENVPEPILEATVVTGAESNSQPLPTVIVGDEALNADAGERDSAVFKTGGASQADLGADFTAPLYNADADQKFNFTFQGKGRNAGKEYPVAITFSPVADGDYVAYDKMRDVRLSGESDGIATSNQTLNALLWLGKNKLKAVEGWGPNGVKNLSDARLTDAVQNALIACDIEPRAPSVVGDAASDEPWRDDDIASLPIRLRCIAEGKLIVTVHTPGDVEDDVFEALRKRHSRLGTKGKLVDSDARVGQRDTKVPSRAEDKGKIYDELKFTATGYRGRIPLWHKEKVVDDLFEVEQELVEGK